jgi:hypothetical protein
MSDVFKNLAWPIFHLHKVAEKLSEAIDAAEPLSTGVFDIGGRPANDLIQQLDEIRWAILAAEAELLTNEANRKKKAKHKKKK